VAIGVSPIAFLAAVAGDVCSVHCGLNASASLPRNGVGHAQDRPAGWDGSVIRRMSGFFLRVPDFARS